jgi:hypothetical protein
MAKSRGWNLLALAVLLPLAACAANPPVKAAMAPPTRIPAVEPPAPAGEPIAIASVPRDVRRAVVADAAKRFKVASNAVVLANAEKVNWNDGALGCPEPGHLYTQMIVAGFRVVAKTREGNLTYHTDANGNVRSCLDSSPLPMMDTEPQPYPPKPAASEK